MKEIKVYVDRDLLSSFYTRSGTDLSKRKWVQAEIVFYNVNNIYLYDIKTHDRELVKEVCEKIKELGLKHNIEDLNGVFISYKALQEIQKEYEK